ncbi:MAG: hypothetical protein NZ898_02655 [Myxococcota bacterium]|nr:hypothetical protein [Myxococcota bacterium]MDW8361273.1 hypothetical protein [Myxococcales bacterium]
MRGRPPLAPVVALLGVGLPTAPARADVAGRVGVAALASPRAQGGALLAEAGWGLGALELGPSVGVAMLTAEGEADTRAVMPLGAVLGWEHRGARWVTGARARAGLWSGALHEGLRAGPFGGAELGAGLRVADKAALSVGAGAWWLGGPRATWVGTLLLSVGWWPAPGG